MRITLSRFLAAALLLGGMTFATNVSAQRGGGPGGGDRAAEFQKMMLDRMRERFEVKDDGEWKLISERLGKVMELRRGNRGGFPGGRGVGGPPRGRGGRPESDAAGAGGGARPERADRPERGDRGRDRADRGGRGPGGEPNPEREALEKALESGSTADIKAKLAAFRASRKAEAAKLQKAQDELREVLSLKQEGTAVAMGLIE